MIVFGCDDFFDEERLPPPPPHHTTSDSSDPFITTDEEQPRSPPNSPEDIPYQPESPPPPPPEEEIPHPILNLPPPPNPNRTRFYSPHPDEYGEKMDQYISTTDNLYRHEREAEDAQAEAREKHTSLSISLDQERQKARFFRQAVKANREKGLKPDGNLVDRYRAHRAGVRKFEKMMKYNEDHIQPLLRQNLEDIRERLRLYHHHSFLEGRMNRSEHDTLENEVVDREREIAEAKSTRSAVKNLSRITKQKLATIALAVAISSVR
jgi:hypothetical protein